MEQEIGPVRRRRRTLTRQEGVQILRGYVNGKTGQALAEEFHVSSQVIALVLLDRYTRWQNPDAAQVLQARRGRQNRFLTTQDVAGIRRMRLGGATLSEIGAHYLVSDSTVSRIVRGILHGPAEAR